MSPDTYSLEERLADCRFLVWLLHQGIDRGLASYALADLLGRTEKLRPGDRTRLRELGLRPLAGASITNQEIVTLLSESRPTVLVLCIKQRELRGVLGFFELSARRNPASREADGTRVWEVELEDMNVAIAMVGQERASHLDSVLSSLLDTYQPDFATLCGVAAGVRSGLCDVVIAERLINYDGGVRTSEEVRRRPEIETLSTKLSREVAYFEAFTEGLVPDFAAGLQSLREVGVAIPASVAELRPSILAGTVMTGEKLILDPDFLAELSTELDERFRALDQESWAFAVRCRERGLDYLVARGVSDFGTKETIDPGETSDKPTSDRRSVQCVAAMAAVSTAISFVRHVVLTRSQASGT